MVELVTIVHLSYHNHKLTHEKNDQNTTGALEMSESEKTTIHKA